MKTKEYYDFTVFHEGFNAFSNGENVDANPYNYFSFPELYNSWEVGWEKALLENVKQNEIHFDSTQNDFFLI